MFFRLLMFPALFVLLSATVETGGPIRVMTSVMTYNIHLENCKESHRPWEERKAMVAQIIHSRAPEILGLQGATLGQTDWLNASLKDYEYYAPAHNSLEMGVDLCPILYSRNSFESVGQGTYLVGEAVSKIEAKPEKNTSQFLNWVKLKHRSSQKEIYVFNTRIHLNPSSTNHRAIVQRMEDYITELVQDETFIFLADMAQGPESEAIKGIGQWANDSESNSLVSISDKEVTNPGWKKFRKEEGHRTDYIFLSFDIPANSYEVLDVAQEGEYPSDHLPVFCRLRIQ
ncbi:MAG: hypothetical protein HKN45_00795 [Flavobacteriales bacterium]|nr:hypothetical protein [Flavobacteriales bacterium]